MDNVIIKGNREETDQERLTRLKNEEEAEKLAAERAKHSPFRSFLQVNQENYEAEDWLMRTSPPAYRLLRFLASNMDNYNALICSYQVMQEQMGYGRATLSRAVKLLREHQYIQVAKSGTSNVYFINRELYWKSWGKNYKYAEFGAKIILSADEQDKTDQKILVEKRCIATLKDKPEGETA